MNVNDGKSVTHYTRQWNFLAGFVPLVGLSPSIIFLIANSTKWAPTAYIPVGFLWWTVLVLRTCWSHQQTATLQRMWVATGVLLAALIFTLCGVLYVNPWLFNFAFMLAFAGWSLGRLGDLHWGAVLGLTLALATLIWFPTSLNQAVADLFNLLNASFAASSLDALGIPCIRTGLLLETQSQRLMFSEIGSGPSSIFALVCFAVLLSNSKRSGAIHSVCLAGFAVVFAALASSITALCIVAGSNILGQDFTFGRDFTILEFLVLAGTLLTIAAASKFLDALLCPLMESADSHGPAFNFLNKALHWPGEAPYKELEASDHYDREKAAALKAARTQPSTPYLWKKGDWLGKVMIVVPLCIAATGLFGAMQNAPKQLRLLAVGTTDFSQQIPSEAEENLLPSQIQSWELKGSARERRHPRNALGSEAIVWLYQNGTRRFTVELSFPRLDSQLPTATFSKQGWVVRRVAISDGTGNLETDSPSSMTPSLDRWEWGEAELESDLGVSTYLAFCMLSSELEPAQLPTEDINPSISFQLLC